MSFEGYINSAKFYKDNWFSNGLCANINPYAPVAFIDFHFLSYHHTEFFDLGWSIKKPLEIIQIILSYLDKLLLKLDSNPRPFVLLQT